MQFQEICVRVSVQLNVCGVACVRACVRVAASSMNIPERVNDSAKPFISAAPARRGRGERRHVRCEGRRSINISAGGSPGVEECAPGTLGTLTICEGLERLYPPPAAAARGSLIGTGGELCAGKLSRARYGSHAAGEAAAGLRRRRPPGGGAARRRRRRLEDSPFFGFVHLLVIISLSSFLFSPSFSYPFL